jgi:aspartate kinase
MLELSISGSKILHPRSILTANRYNLSLRVCSSFQTDDFGTCIINQEVDKKMENPQITAIALNKNLRLVSFLVVNMEDLGVILLSLNKHQIKIEKLIMNKNEVKFITDLETHNIISQVMEKLVDAGKIENLDFIDDVSAVSVIGYGIKHHFILMEYLINVINHNNDKVIAFENSEIRSTIFFYQTNAEQIVKEMHMKFFTEK